MSRTVTTPSSPAEADCSWAPPLAGLRLIADGRSTAMLSPDASVQWWCAPDFDDPPLCWRLLDPDGGTARFPDLAHVDAGHAARTAYHFHQVWPGTVSPLVVARIATQTQGPEPTRLERWVGNGGWLVDLLLPRTDAGVAVQAVVVTAVFALLLRPARRGGVLQLWVGAAVLSAGLFVLRGSH